MKQIESLIDHLTQEQWAVSTELFSPSSVKSLLEELQHFEAQGMLRDAKIGRLNQEQKNPNIRDTKILWFDPESLTPTQQSFWSVAEAIREALNRTCFLSLCEFECHYAIYPVGAYYRRHSDQFHKDDRRLISFLLYLNEEWKPEDNGLLRLYLQNEKDEKDEKYIDIMPEAGNAAIFQSAALEHEVLPTNRKRYCIVGWMKTRATRTW